MISETECSLFAIRGLFIWLVVEPVAPKSAEASPFTLVAGGRSNNSIPLASATAAGTCFPQG